jgi:hypothetical protein
VAKIRIKNFKTVDLFELFKMIIFTILIWVVTISAFFPLTLAFDLQEKTITLLG